MSKLTEKDLFYKDNGKDDSPLLDEGRDKYHEYLILLKNNIIPIIIIEVAVIVIAIIISYNFKDIYQSGTAIKILKPQESILSTNILGIENFANDRYIANEIEMIKTFPIRELAAGIILDSAKKLTDLQNYYFILKNPKKPEDGLVSSTYLADKLGSITKISQRKGLDIIELSVESPSPIESSFFANLYSKAFTDYSFKQSRQDLTNIINYLSQEKEKMKNELLNAENSLGEFQERTGLINLDAKTNNLIENISRFDQQLKEADINLRTEQFRFNKLKDEIETIDPSIPAYLDGILKQQQVGKLQEQITDLELQKEVRISNLTDSAAIRKVIRDYDIKIEPLKSELDSKIKIVEQSLLLQSPEDRRNFAKDLVYSNIGINDYNFRKNYLNRVLSNYEVEFQKLPKEALEFAKIERQKSSSEKLYLILEEKYQEALINQNARLGNVAVVNPARIPNFPSRPDRPYMIFVGAVVGLIISIFVILVRNFLDRTIKSPDQLESKGVSVLAWLPNMAELSESKLQSDDFILSKNPNSSVAEAFKVLRVRLSFSKIDTKVLKKILITSSIPSEGKSTVAINLAGSFAINNKKTVIIDCDLRKPRQHNILELERFPGLSDYLFDNVDFESIIKKTSVDNLYAITSGTIPPNPTELISSLQMVKFLEKVSENFDMVIIDSPPSLSVADAEVLFKITDGTIIVSQTYKTPWDAFLKVYNRFKSIDRHNILGVVVNKFDYKKSYGYYYNYYYSYSSSNPKSNKKVVENKTS